MEIKLHSEGYQSSIALKGAELKSFQNPSGKEFMWNGNPEFWNRSAPVLFPMVGNLRNNKTSFYGKEYPMSKHGFARDFDFTLLEQTENQAVFSLQDNEETRKSYPFSFELKAIFTLEKNTLHITYEVQNKEDKRMYYHIGMHPGFVCPLEEGEHFSDYVFAFDKKEHLEAIVYDLEHLCFSSSKKTLFAENADILPLNYSMFENDAIYFRNTNSRAVRLINPHSQKGILLSYDDFSSIGFWSPIGKEAPFVCIEPWNGAAIFDDEDDNFMHKRDLEILNSQEKKSYHLSISLIGY